MRDATTDPTLPGRDPAEGRTDMNLPGADQAAQDPREPDDRPDIDRNPPDGPDSDLPERLGERISNGPGAGIGGGEPDLVPDVKVPDESM